MPGQILVKFKTGSTPAGIRAVQERIGASTLRELKTIRVHQVKLPSLLSVERALEEYRRDPKVEYAEPNYIGHLTATTPNDTYFTDLWGLNNTGQTVNGDSGTAGADIHGPEAWDFTTGSDSLVIAVIDSGVDYNHPDLSANIWSNPGEIAGNGIDDDGNGHIDDVRGWDFVDDDNDPMDSNDHGTHVSGTIAARGNNNAGTTGVCWRAKIMPLRAFTAFGTGDVASVVASIDYARQKGAKIINASFGFSNYSQAMYDAIASANSAGILFVAAAGNESADNDATPSYPANYSLPNIISVAATDQNDDLAGFSNYGASTVHVAAPGVNILSAQPARQTVWNENFDDGDMSNWTTGGTNDTWGLSDSVAVSGSYSLSTSPSADYLSGTVSWAQAPLLDLSAYAGVTMSFKFKGKSQENVDLLYVQTSTDGASWTDQDIFFPDFGGGLPYIDGDWSDDWYNAQVDLGGYDGRSTVYLRFYFKTNGSVNDGGFFFDDLSVTAASSVYAGDEYQFLMGTSMATPHVAGLAGLLWSYYPAWTMSQVRSTLMSTVDKKDSLRGKVSSGGRINAYNGFLCYDSLSAPTALQAVLATSGQIHLTWTDNSGYEVGFKVERRLAGETTFTQIDTTSTNVNSYNDTTAVPGRTYYYQVKAYNCAGDSGYSNEAGASTANPQSTGGSSTGGCFIATAAFGSPLAPRVVILRQFRDTFLLSSGWGRSLTAFYYRYSPAVAGFIEKRNTLRGAVRFGLLPLVAFGYSCLHFGLAITTALSLGLLGGIIFAGVWGRRNGRKKARPPQDPLLKHFPRGNL